MLALLGKVGGFAALALLIAACGPKETSDQRGEELNIDLVDTRSSDGEIGDGDSGDPSAEDMDVNLGDYTDEGGSLESEPSQARVWVGMSGVPQGCTLTNYHDLQDVQAVMRNDGAVVMEKTPNLIILRKSAPKGQFKLVYTTDEALCEVVVTRAGFTDPDGSETTSDEGESGN